MAEQVRGLVNSNQKTNPNDIKKQIFKRMKMFVLLKFTLFSYHVSSTLTIMSKYARRNFVTCQTLYQATRFYTFRRRLFFSLLQVLQISGGAGTRGPYH